MVFMSAIVIDANAFLQYLHLYMRIKFRVICNQIPYCTCKYRLQVDGRRHCIFTFDGEALDLHDFPSVNLMLTEN